MMWIRKMTLIACIALVKGGLLKLRVDDEVTLYVGGKVVHNEFTIRRWQWKELAEISIDDTAEIVAFRMYNQGPRRLGYGIGEIDGKDLFSSDIVCKDVPKKQDPDAFFPGWFEEDYDDSDWTPPVAVESHHTEGILSDAQGFWGQRKSSKNVLCRLKLTRGPCAENPCKNHGTCKEVGDGYTCECSPVFSGKHCEDCATSNTVQIDAVAFWPLNEECQVRNLAPSGENLDVLGYNISASDDNGGRWISVGLHLIQTADPPGSSFLEVHKDVLPAVGSGSFSWVASIRIPTRGSDLVPDLAIIYRSPTGLDTRNNGQDVAVRQTQTDLPLVQNEWNTIATSFDATTNMWVLYVDGQEASVDRLPLSWRFSDETSLHFMYKSLKYDSSSAEVDIHCMALWKGTLTYQEMVAKTAPLCEIN